ncbi:MAG TPA: branched-chain amino acid ABC transporter permease [Symbiobacteriaceae bacterium]|nr:branched-chain amino acid ABC transporter permease [Symbiobacteriaceae bacterium]
MAEVLNNYKRQILVGAATVGVYVLLEVLRITGALGDYWMRITMLSMIMTISALGLSLIYGFAGQFSLGHAAFYGIGAYTAGFMTKMMGGSIPMFVIALITGALVAGFVGFLIGLPILRLRSDYLGISTLGFGIIVKVLIDNTDKLHPAFGGARGMGGIPDMTNLAWVFWAAVGAILLTRNLVNSSHGRACISVREDEIAADLMGIDTTRFKTLAFVVGCSLAGLAGGLYAHFDLYLHPSSFDFLKSLDVLLIVVLGGLGSLTGTVVTAVGMIFALEGLRDLMEWRGVIWALILIVLMIVRPQGLMGGKEFSIMPKKTTAKGGSQRASA